jgi:hypothetical protein
LGESIDFSCSNAIEISFIPLVPRQRILNPLGVVSSMKRLVSVMERIYHLLIEMSIEKKESPPLLHDGDLPT